jgi:hypothetical protein
MQPWEVGCGAELRVCVAALRSLFVRLAAMLFWCCYSSSVVVPIREVQEAFGVERSSLPLHPYSYSYTNP